MAARLGRYALCTCTDLNLTGDLSAKGPGTSRATGGVGGNAGTGGTAGFGDIGVPGLGGPPGPSFGAAVGTDGNANIAGPVEIGGSFIAAGGRNVTFSRGMSVRGNLRGGGDLTAYSRMQFFVAGDAYAGGDVLGNFVVGGALHIPANASIGKETQIQNVINEDVRVAPPCNCGAGPFFDFGSTIASRAITNDNSSLTFPIASLTDESAPQTLDWPCGEYYLSEILTRTEAALEFRIHGRVGIFVAGDVRLGSILHVTLDPGAELDLVVGGSFFTNNRVFGSPQQPAGTRLWVGGTTVSLQTQVQLGALVYAPAAVFSAGVGLTFSGSLFVGTLSVAGDVRITYDPAALQAGQSCGFPPPGPIE